MQLEIWSDIACPWCAVGRAHLQRALDGWEHRDTVEVTWRSFELDPSAPATLDGPYVDRLAAKYGTSAAEAQAMIDRMVATGAAAGVDLRFDRIRPGNTFDAHRVVHLAAERGMQDAVKQRMLTGYLTEGEAIGTADAVRRLGVDAGLDATEVDDVLAGDRYADAVREDEATARALGISGVPFFVLDRRLGVSGAQPPEVLRSALDQARDAAGALVTVGGPSGEHEHDGGACADGSCAL